MKIVVNKCFGGFSLSAAATKEYYKRKGKECYFFINDYKSDKYEPINEEDADARMFYHSFSMSNPQDYKDEGFNDIYLTSRPEDRTDPDLIAVVELLGEKANGSCAELEIVEIPDGVDYEIQEYDGLETIHEQHRSW